MRDALPDRLRLGDFEVDLRVGEVRSGDRRVRLQEKSLRVLQILLEHGDELVSRNEIQRKLWPNDTIVDFENGINTAIKKLRQALDDSPETPRYIETIPRRGYRLMVPVELLSADNFSVGVSAGADGTAVRLQPEPGLIGKKVSHYRVLEVIGGGGMGMVYKAEDLKLRSASRSQVPSRRASRDTVALQRFQREAEAAARLTIPISALSMKWKSTMGNRSS